MSMTNYEFPKYDGTQPCASMGVDLYYYEHDVDIPFKGLKEQENKLKILCSECPFLSECRDYAIHHEIHGFWGGMTSADRKNFRRKFNIIPELIELRIPHSVRGILT